MSFAIESSLPEVLFSAYAGRVSPGQLIRGRSGNESVGTLFVGWVRPFQAVTQHGAAREMLGYAAEVLLTKLTKKAWHQRKRLPLTLTLSLLRSGTGRGDSSPHGATP
jgi:hypothetical protein